MHVARPFTVAASVAVVFAFAFSACGDSGRRKLGATCSGDDECASGLCLDSLCLDPVADEDSDGLTNGLEAQLGTDPKKADTDGDAKADGDELGDAKDNVDSDGDGIADSLESASADADGDCIPDEQDPANDTPASPTLCGEGLPNGAACEVDGVCTSGHCVNGFCGPGAGEPQPNGASCTGDGGCVSGFCQDGTCADPSADVDADGLSALVERTVGSDPDAPDTDGDGKRDDSELDGQQHNRDSDGDGKPDIIESSKADADGDCIADEQDPHDAVKANPDHCQRLPWNVIFQPGNIDVSACRQNLSWASQNLFADGNGDFDETWAPNEPNTARIQGHLDAASFNATISCLPGGTPSGTFTCSKLGDAYFGSWSFNGKSGPMMVFQNPSDTISMQGVVVASGTRTPIAGATVTLSVDSGTSVTTNANGLFYIVTDAPSTNGANTPYTVSISASGYAPFSAENSWGDHPSYQEFQLQPQ